MFVWKIFNFKNDWNWNTGSEVKYSSEYSYRAKQDNSIEHDIELLNVGLDVGIESVKGETTFSDEVGKFTVTGPAVGVDVGAKSGVKGTGVSALAELSLVKGELKYRSLYLSAGVNANTGLKFGSEGLQANCVGFGLTLGVGGKWTIDTPLGSIGGSSPIKVADKQRKQVAIELHN